MNRSDPTKVPWLWLGLIALAVIALFMVDGSTWEAIRQEYGDGTIWIVSVLAALVYGHHVGSKKDKNH